MINMSEYLEESGCRQEVAKVSALELALGVELACFLSSFSPAWLLHKSSSTPSSKC